MIVFGLIGLIVGIIEGTLGAGAGAIMIPLLIWNGMSYQEAVAVGLAINSVPRGVPGLYLYYKQGKWRIKESIVMIITSTFGILVGSYVFTTYKISNKLLSRIFAVVMMMVSIVMWISNT